MRFSYPRTSTLALSLRRKLFPLCLLVSLATVSSAALSVAQVPPSVDFDGDGTSELVTVTAATSGLQWNAVGSAASTEVLNTVFGESGDLYAPGCWLQPGVPQVGVVRFDSKRGVLNWRTVVDGSVVSQRSFGGNGDLIFTGADFDGNGIADAALVRVRNKKFLWRISLDHLADSPGKVRSFTLGAEGDRAFILNVNGEYYWFGAFGKGGGSRAVASVRSIFSKKVSRVRGIAGGLTEDTRPRPYSVLDADGNAMLVFIEPEGGDSRISAYSQEGKRIFRKLVAGSGAVAIGDYLPSEPGEEVALQVSTGVSLVNPSTGTVETRAAASGTIVGGVNSHLVKLTPTPTAVPTTSPTPVPSVAPTATVAATPTVRR